MRDMSSGLGGFCILEENDTDYAAQSGTYGFVYFDDIF